jgi:hypothetical protein
MYNLTKAIITKAAGSDFLNSMSGRLYHSRAPENSDYPYCAFLLPVSDEPRYVSSFTETLEDIMMQFSIFSAQKSPLEVLTAYGYLKALYDDCSFTVTGSKLIWFVRGNSILMAEDHTVKGGTIQVWHYAIDYSIITQET